jgi:hypothetical protein
MLAPTGAKNLVFVEKCAKKSEGKANVARPGGEAEPRERGKEDFLWNVGGNLGADSLLKTVNRTIHHQREKFTDRLGL